MASNEKRAQKKREKQKKKRDEARKVRGSRKPPEPQAGERVDRGLKGADAWPIGECYLSEDWHEQGARVHAGFVREADDGRRAAAFFEVDLRRDGVVECLARGGVSLGAIQGEMARRSELSGKAMLVAEPDLVVKLVHTGYELTRSAGNPLPDGLDEAMGLFGTLDGSTAAEAILTGDPPPPPPKKKTLFGLLFGD
ncbi:MAG: hypothetical protein H6737_19550 [Alphaproteobacteria bacterium]|nr:hypothetical protein [Alphaproteobacteria bacterium]